jgi:hypothetical protein
MFATIVNIDFHIARDRLTGELAELEITTRGPLSKVSKKGRQGPGGMADTFAVTGQGNAAEMR